VRAYRATLRAMPLDPHAVGFARAGLEVGSATPSSAVMLVGVATVASTPSAGFSLRMAGAAQLPRGRSLDVFERLMATERPPGVADVERSPDPSGDPAP